MDDTQAPTYTRLNLLTRDGAVTVEFAPELEPPHYNELFTLASDFETEFDLRSVVAEAANRWGRTVQFD
jgi:hypothetical protein